MTQSSASKWQLRPRLGKKFMISVIAFAGTSLVTPAALLAQEVHSEFEQSRDAVGKRLDAKEFSPYAGRTYPTRVFWGDQHLHTSVSVDAGTMNRLGQEDAYRFALGKEVTSTTGVQAKLSRPLSSANAFVVAPINSTNTGSHMRSGCLIGAGRQAAPAPAACRQFREPVF
jgi:hypothetical protein